MLSPTSRRSVATIPSASRWSNSRRSATRIREQNVCVGYKDLGPDEFWVRGHMPGLPLMPGVIMCEAAAQLASYYSHKYKLMEGVIGFGGLEDVRFRGVVRPGDRFVIVSRLLKLRRSIMTCEFQCFVKQNLVCEGVLKGVSLPREQITGDPPSP